MNELLLVLVGVVVVFGGHYLLSRFGPTWAGAIFPVTWVLLVGWLLFEGQMNSLRDWLMAAVGFLCLLSVHRGVFRAREEKFQRENDKIDNTIIQ